MKLRKEAKNNVKQQLWATIEGGLTTRYHTIPCIKPQTVAQHSWGVAMLITQIAPSSILNVPDRLNRMLSAALLHDLPEATIGDVPAPTKWSCPEIDQRLKDLEEDVLYYYGFTMDKLSDDERELLLWADLLELMCHTLTEYRMGNRWAAEIFYRGYDYLRNRKPPSEKAAIYREMLAREVEEVGSSSGRQSKPTHRRYFE